MSEKQQQDMNQQAEASADQAAADSAAGPDTAELKARLAAEMQASVDAGDFDINAYLDQYQTVLIAKEEAETKLIRLQADFDNFRRRSRQDNETAVHSANCCTLSALLPVLDNLERAVLAMADGPDKEGVVLIARQFLSALQSVGLEEILAEGAEFDPNLHQAVLQTEAGPDKQGKITMVLQKGYLLNSKLLRAAMVQVGV